MAVVPRTIGEIGAGWLERALRAGGALPEGGKVAGVEVEPLGEGVGLLGELARIHVTYEGAGDLPASFVVKLPSTHEANRFRGNQFGFYEREIRFYSDIAPKIELRTPRCYAASREDDAFVLLLEDLSSLDAPDQVAGLGIDEAMVAVEHLARFQAGWWDSPELDALDWLPPANGPVTMQAGPVFRQCWPLFLENFGDHLPVGGAEVGERVGAAFEQLLEPNGHRPLTIVHTDFRLDNFFFGPAGRDEFVLIDWQLMTKGRGCYDVAYLLCQSMPVDRRREVEDEVLRHWWDTLVANGVDGYSFGDAREDYDRSALICLVIPVTAGADMDLGNERGRALLTALAQRSFAAVLDRDAGRLVPPEVRRS